ncbi:MAG TPA: hypothetical protein VK700_12155 [Steroidobacteraceae bacterium]|jgi:hypothetical protein|nr:hypothetical protein [Steroidobacteraceae bacterium]
MTAPQTYQHLLETSRRVNWRLENLIGEGRRLDFTRPFLPETYAQTEPLGFLSPAEKLKLNQIRARGYLALFELVEAFVVPFISEQANDGAAAEPFRAQALRHFAGEEEKHRQMFSSMLREFDAAFGTQCGLIGPAEDICRAILGHGPLAVTIAILGLEWMSQGHYLGSIKDNQDLDPQFKSLLKHHWIEEAQHAKLDALVLRSLAERSSAQQIATAVQEYFEIGAFLDGGFKQQSQIDLESLQRTIGRTLSEDERRQFLKVQHQALRWTFLGSAMQNPNFLAVLAGISDEAAAHVQQAANLFIMH